MTISTSDIDWANTSEEELRGISQHFSFELEVCTGRIRRAPNWTKVIIAQLYVDFVLDKILEENLRKPKAILSGSRRRYLVDKLDICDALGLLNSQTIALAKKVNSIRNNMAHTLSFTVDKKSIQELRSVLSHEQKSIIEDTLSRKRSDSASILLEEILIYLVAQVEILRQRNLFQNLMHQWSHRRLEAALKKAAPLFSEDEGQTRT